MKKNHNRPHRTNGQNATPKVQSNGGNTEGKVNDEKVAQIVGQIQDHAKQVKEEMFDKLNQYRIEHGQEPQEPHLTPAEKSALEKSKSEKDLESEETNMVDPILNTNNIPGQEGAEEVLKNIPSTNPNAGEIAKAHKLGEDGTEETAQQSEQQNKASDKEPKEKKAPKTSVLIEDTGDAVMNSVYDADDPNIVRDDTLRKLVGDYLHENVKLVQFITKKGFGYSITAGKSTDSSTQKVGYRTRVAMVKPAAKPMYAVLSLPAFVKEEIVKIINNVKVDVDSFSKLDTLLARKVYNVQRMANPDVQFEGCDEAVIAEYADAYKANKADNPESVKVNKSTSYLTLSYDMFCYLLTTVLDGDILEAAEIKPDAVKKFVKRKEAKEGEEAKPIDLDNPQEFKTVAAGDGSESHAVPGYHAVRPSELDMGLFLRFYDEMFAAPVTSALTANNKLDKGDAAKKSATKVITDTVNNILFSNPDAKKKEDLKLSENGNKIASYLADLLQTDEKKEGETGLTRMDEASAYLKKMDFAKVVRQCRAYIDGTAVVIRDKGAFNKLYTEKNFTALQRVETKKIFLDSITENDAIAVCKKAYSVLQSKGGSDGANRVAGDMKLWSGQTLEILTQASGLSGVEKYRKLTDVNYSDGANVADGAKQMSAKEIDAAYEPKKDFTFKDFYTGAPILPSNAGGIEVYSYVNAQRTVKATGATETIVKLPTSTLTTGEITSENKDKVYAPDAKTKQNFLLFDDLKQSSGVLDDILSQISKKGRKGSGSSKAPAQKKKAASRDTVRKFRFARTQAEKSNSNFADAPVDNGIIM